METKDIIIQGKLKTYSMNKSFLEVYWSHPSLQKHEYYLFVFTTLKNDLISVTFISPRVLPIKYKPKIFIPAIEEIMQTLLESL